VRSWDVVELLLVQSANNLKEDVFQSMTDMDWNRSHFGVRH
jgi:hypothetical protein